MLRTKINVLSLRKTQGNAVLWIWIACAKTQLRCIPIEKQLGGFESDVIRLNFKDVIRVNWSLMLGSWVLVLPEAGKSPELGHSVTSPFLLAP